MSATIHDILKDKYTMDYELNYIGASTCRRSKASLSHMKKTQLAIIPIAELQKRDIDDYLLTLTKYSNSNIKKYFQQLKLGFSLACEQEIINKNIMLRSDIRCPKSDKPDKKVTGYTIEEQNKILKAIAAHKVPYGRNDYRNQLLLELYTGMRMGEINALTPDDIDFEKSIIHVSRTVSRGFEYEPFIKKGTKTYAGVRDIPLTKSAELVLKDAISKMPKNSHNLIFYDMNRRDIMTTNQVNSFFGRICDKAGVAKNGQHALRHTFATRCIESGIDALVLKKWMGHTNIHITLDTYTDVFGNMNNDAIQKFDGYLENVESIDLFGAKQGDLQ